jgi:two-component system, OmpR family, response regulator
MKILLIEDDAEAAQFAARGLREAGHLVDTADDAEDGEHMALEGHYDVFIVDRMLPGGDGLSIVKKARAASVTTPALFLTAVGGVGDRVEGLEAGADDYLVKPYVFSELLARVNALGRRPRTLEFRLLEFLVRHSGLVVTRDMLLQKVWGFDFEPRANLIDAHMSRLRAKVDRPFGRDRIQTARGTGYRLDDHD